LIEKSVDDIICETLLQNGTQTFNQLCILAKDVRSNKTIAVHLQALRKQGIVERKKRGQYVEYSLNHSQEALDAKFVKLLDKLEKDSRIDYPKIIEHFKKFQKTKTSRLKHNDSVKIFFYGLDSVELIFRWYRLLLLMVMGGFGTSEITHKAKELQKTYNQQIQELFQTLRSIDPSISRMIFNNIFNDLYPVQNK